MKPLRYSTVISAPASAVWHAMLDDETYREWTGEFHEGSHFLGSWEQGAEIRFVGPDVDGVSGLVAHIVENRPDEFVSIRYDGMIAAGVADTTSDGAAAIAGLHENYTFDEVDGSTTLTVDLESPDDWVQMFEDSWPKSLETLKSIAEREAR